MMAYPDSLNAEVVRQRMDFISYSGQLQTPGRYLAEIFPILSRLPDFLTPWKVAIRSKGDGEAALNISLVDTVRSDVSHAQTCGKETPPNLTKSMLEMKAAGAKGMDILTERWFAGVPGGLFGAGSDTTSSMVQSLILGLVTYPAVYFTLQNELDAVLGSTRSPTLADRRAGTLPYLAATVQEALRWRPASPLGVPHATSSSDSWSGFRIPQGTSVIANAWAINHNPTYFPSPEIFAPSRFLPSTDPRFNASLLGEPFPAKCPYPHATFGWGRRQCPGSELASSNIFVLIGKLVWGCEILPVEGERYEEVVYGNGVVTRPTPFKVGWNIRSEAHMEVLLKEMLAAERELEKFPVFA